MAEDLPSEPEGDIGRFPVFVDDTGRRHRRLRIAGWCIGIVAASYVALFVLSLASSPTLLPLTIPGVGRLLPNAGAPDIRVPGHGRSRVSTVVATSSPAPATAGGSASASPAPVPTSSVRPSAHPTPSTRPTAKPTAVPSATPSARPTARPTPRGTGKPTARPTSGHRRSPAPQSQTGHR